MKIEMGTGIGRFSVTIQGIELIPYGHVCSASINQLEEIKKKEWKVSKGISCLWIVLPKELYQCLSYKKGSPSVDGEQVLEVVLDDPMEYWMKKA